MRDRERDEEEFAKLNRRVRVRLSSFPRNHNTLDGSSNDVFNENTISKYSQILAISDMAVITFYIESNDLLKCRSTEINRIVEILFITRLLVPPFLSLSWLLVVSNLLNFQY